MAVTLTERAAVGFKKFCEEHGIESDSMLRISVVGGGCSGFSYELLPTTDLDEKLDSVYEYHGVKVIVDKKSALYLDGAVVDYPPDLTQPKFRVDNPNAVKTCGCGSSFQA